MNIQLLPLSPQSPYFDGAISVYRQSTGADTDSSHQFFTKYAESKSDYVGLVAVLEDDTVAGMTFGTQSTPGDWWHDRVAEAVGAAHPALQDAWVLIELHVRQDCQNQGIGTHLHDEVIARQPYQKLLLSTGKSNTGAKRLYERLGWQYLHPGLALRTSSSLSVIMNRNLDSE